MFKWACLSVATAFLVLFGGAMLYMVNDLRHDVKTTLSDLKRDMPEIVANTKKGSNTLAAVSDDIKSVRTILGLTAGENKKLLVYTGEVLDVIEKDGAGATILPDNQDSGITAKLAQRLVGEKPISVEAWVAQTRTKALWVSLFGSTSREEVLDKLCHNKFGVPYLIQFGSEKPLPLKDWVKEMHAGSRS